MQDKQDFLAHRGIALARRVLCRLGEVGIFAQPSVSLEHQHLAGQYVVRGVESGGSVREIGRYVTFCGSDGEPLSYLHPIDAIGVNGLHAVVIAPILVRIELFRVGRTCQLLITKHQPGKIESGRRPHLENSVVFHGVNGFLDREQFGKEINPLGSAMPQFWSRGGEDREIPPVFAAAVRAATTGATCIGCSHTHWLIPLHTVEVNSGSV
jgi:hypothetical protein